MEPGLTGTVTLEVPGQAEELEIPGENFSWEEGGEHNTNYTFIDHDTDVEVRVDVEEGQAVFSDFYLDDVKLKVVMPTDIRANDALMAHTPEDF